MATDIPSFSDIALQLETATAQLRVLASFPEAQREGKVHATVEEIKKSVDETKKAMEVRIQKQERQLQSLRDTTNKRLLAVEAGVYNAKMRVYNSSTTTVDSVLKTFVDTAKKPIAGMPETARGVLALSDSQVTSMLGSLGWNFTSETLREKQKFLLRIMGFTCNVDYYY